jgi:hypothetical protein
MTPYSLAMIMEAVRNSETSVHFCDTTMRHLHARLCENLKTHKDSSIEAVSTAEDTFLIIGYNDYVP